MKAYFIYSNKLPKNVLELIQAEITNSGLNLKTRDHSTKDLNSYNFDEARKTYSNNLKNMKNADVVIAECSYASSGIGFQISQALEEKKPVIALYNLSVDTDNPAHIDKVPSSFKGNTSKYLILKEYDISSLKKSLELAVKDAKSLADTKFILIIPPEIDKYLEWNVKEKGVSKAEITRQAIERMMENDKSYMEYMKSYMGDGASNS